MLESLFSAAGAVAAVGWLLLVFVPRHPVARLIAGVAIPLVLSVGYLLLIVTSMPGAEGGFGSLADVARLFSSPALLLAGWVHYLAFDLFIGAWETRDAAARGIPHAWVVPCLLATFLLGPIGLLGYLTIRSARLRTLELA
jgi:Domain of unknown function (DUF4281)